MKALVEAVARCPNVTFNLGHKTTSISESPTGVTLTFSSGATAHGDLLLGCDGIHSATRTLHVEPSRLEHYSGIANAFGFAPLSAPSLESVRSSGLHFRSTAINFARRGMLLTSYYESSKSSVYVGGLLQIPEVNDRNGWKVRGADQAATKADMKDRFATKDVVHSDIEPLIDAAADWFMWPVYTLSAGGKWATKRTMLLGDAAHAMPPQGEATGIVLEDTVLFARCLFEYPNPPTGVDESKNTEAMLASAFARYEALRRPRIEAAFKESAAVVKTVQDAGAVGHRIKCVVVPWFLWFTRAKREKHFIEDVTTCSLEPEVPKAAIGKVAVPVAAVGAIVAVAAWSWGYI